jgi:hypothetical protein
VDIELADITCSVNCGAASDNPPRALYSKCTLTTYVVQVASSECRAYELDTNGFDRELHTKNLLSILGETLRPIALTKSVLAFASKIDFLGNE